MREFEEDESKFEVLATKEQIKEFKESVLWEDFIRTFNFWRKGFDVENDSLVTDAENTSPSTASVLIHLGDIHGRRKALDYVETLLDQFLDILGGDEDDSGHELAERPSPSK